jgi:hypothetical protein
VYRADGSSPARIGRPFITSVQLDLDHREIELVDQLPLLDGSLDGAVAASTTLAQY